jgi:hypothetical protein
MLRKRYKGFRLVLEAAAVEAPTKPTPGKRVRRARK